MEKSASTASAVGQSITKLSFKGEVLIFGLKELLPNGSRKITPKEKDAEKFILIR